MGCVPPLLGVADLLACMYRMHMSIHQAYQLRSSRYLVVVVVVIVVIAYPSSIIIPTNQHIFEDGEQNKHLHTCTKRKIPFHSIINLFTELYTVYVTL